VTGEFCDQVRCTFLLSLQNNKNMIEILQLTSSAMACSLATKSQPFTDCVRQRVSMANLGAPVPSGALKPMPAPASDEAAAMYVFAFPL